MMLSLAIMEIENSAAYLIHHVELIRSEIYKYLDTEDLERCARTCKAGFFTAVEHLWKHKTLGQVNNLYIAGCDPVSGKGRIRALLAARLSIRPSLRFDCLSIWNKSRQ
jgi:hypothetical protein